MTTHTVKIEIDDDNPSDEGSIVENINVGTENERTSFYNKLHMAMSQACYEGKDFEIQTPLTFLINSFPAGNRTIFPSDFGKIVTNGLIFLSNQRSLMVIGDPNVRSYTYHAFMSEYFGIDYDEYCRLFEGSDADESLKVYKLLNFAIKSEEIEFNSKVIILNEFPKASAWFLLLMYLICKQCKLFLIFIGDKYELKNYQTPNHHSNEKNSYSLVKILRDKEFNVSKGSSSIDEIFSRNFEEFVKLLEKKGTEDNVELTFDLLYFVFKKFEDKFLKCDGDFKAMFLSHYHRCLRSHLLDYEKHLQSLRDVQYVRSFYRYFENGQYHEIMAESNKFLPYLILVQGDRYIYTTNSRYNKKIVTLLNINCLENFVTIRDGNEEIKLELKNMSFEINQELEESLNQYIPQHVTDTSIYQFPLKPYNVSTYYAAQCLTVPMENVELDLDNTPANSMYVALSRIESAIQISKILSSDLANLMVTKHFEIIDKELYYYKIPKGYYEVLKQFQQNFQLDFLPKLKESEFGEVHDISEFECNCNKHIKIKRIKYEETKAAHLQDTKLLSITRFVKENLPHIANISNPDLDTQYQQWLNKKFDPNN